MRYLFHLLRDGTIFHDPEGAEYGSDVEAIDRAVSSARELMAERLKAGMPLGDEVFRIVEETGRFVANVKFSDAIPTRRMGVDHMRD